MKKKTKTSRKETKQNKRLSQGYYTPRQPGAYGGVDALKRATKLKKSVVQDWLSHEDAYTLHKPVRRKFQRRPTIVAGLDDQWQADLIDVQRLRKENDNCSYLLTVIDILSKYAWVVPIKNKSGPTLVEAFEEILAKGRKPAKLQTDKGTEFLNKTFQTYLKVT